MAPPFDGISIRIRQVTPGMASTSVADFSGSNEPNRRRHVGKGYSCLAGGFQGILADHRTRSLCVAALRRSQRQFRLFEPLKNPRPWLTPSQALPDDTDRNSVKGRRHPLPRHRRTSSASRPRCGYCVAAKSAGDRDRDRRPAWCRA